MVHTYRLLILLSTAAARKASWERTLPGSRDSSTKGAALRRKAKFDVLRKKALKNGHEELAAAIDELKRRDAALTEAERANRRPRPPVRAFRLGQGGVAALQLVDGRGELLVPVLERFLP